MRQAIYILCSIIFFLGEIFSINFIVKGKEAREQCWNLQLNFITGCKRAKKGLFLMWGLICFLVRYVGFNI